MIDLVNLCAGLIGFAVFMYVLLDGFDLAIRYTGSVCSLGDLRNSLVFLT